MVAYPSTIDQTVFSDAYTEQPETNQAVFKPDVGPPMIRRRSTLSQDIITIKQWFSSTDWDTFKTFYRTTLKDGTLQFTWVHPRTGAAATFQFEGEAPKIASVFGLTYEVTYTLRLIG